MKQGEMRILAVDGKDRWPTAPDVQTFAEAGFPSVRAPGWWAIGAPAKTPHLIMFAFAGRCQDLNG